MKLIMENWRHYNEQQELELLAEGMFGDAMAWIKKKGGAAKEATRDFLLKLKTELQETKEGAVLLAKIAKGQQLTPEESDFLKTQMKDVAAGVFLLGLFALPGGGIVTAGILKLADKFGVDLKPTAFAESLLNEGFKLKGNSNYFRVELPNIGYAEGGTNLRFEECQSDVDALMQTPEYIAAEEKYVANAKPRTDIVQDEDGNWVEKEVGPAVFRPKFYDVNNAWISDEKNRGKGHGKKIYKAFIEQAVEYSRSSGGVFVGAHHCTIGSGTSPEAKRVWASLARDYTSSGDVIFIGL